MTATSLTHHGLVPTAPLQLPLPPQEEQEDVLLACRYGDLKDVQAFCAAYGPGALAEARDEHGNTVLHMACGNGHLGEPSLIWPFVFPRIRFPFLIRQISSHTSFPFFLARSMHIPTAQDRRRCTGLRSTATWGRCKASFNFPAM